MPQDKKKKVSDTESNIFKTAEIETRRRWVSEYLALCLSRVEVWEKITERIRKHNENPKPGAVIHINMKEVSLTQIDRDIKAVKEANKKYASVYSKEAVKRGDTMLKHLIDNSIERVLILKTKIGSNQAFSVTALKELREEDKHLLESAQSLGLIIKNLGKIEGEMKFLMDIQERFKNADSKKKAADK